MTTAEKIALILNSLPSYAEADITTSLRDEPFHLMVRDRPTWSADTARRCTCTTTGTEWFITAAMLDDIDAVMLEVVSFDNRNNEPLWRIL